MGRVSQKFHKGSRYTRWRKAVLKKGGFKCSLCGSTYDLTADHIKPVVTHFELAYDTKNGRILCDPCRVTDMLHSFESGKFQKGRCDGISSI